MIYMIILRDVSRIIRVVRNRWGFVWSDGTKGIIRGPFVNDYAEAKTLRRRTKPGNKVRGEDRGATLRSWMCVYVLGNDDGTRWRSAKKKKRAGKCHTIYSFGRFRPWILTGYCVQSSLGCRHDRGGPHGGELPPCIANLGCRWTRTMSPATEAAFFNCCLLWTRVSKGFWRPKGVLLSPPLPPPLDRLTKTVDEDGTDNVIQAWSTHVENSFARLRYSVMVSAACNHPLKCA